MSDSGLEHLDNEEYSSRVVEHSLTAGPLTSQQSIFGETLRFSMITWIPFPEIAMDAAYINSQTSECLRSFVMANLQICNIFAAEARLTNDP